MYENDTAVVVEEEDAIMPEGWQEGDDIFSEADSSLSGLADESGEEEHDEAEQDATTPQSQAPTTEPEEEDGGDSAETDEQVPTTEPEPAKGHDKLRFKARVDRTDLDVELDPDELPTIYQKAQVTDRLQGKLAKLNPLVEKTEHLARAMGYDSVDAMLDAAEKNYTDNEVARLVQEVSTQRWPRMSWPTGSPIGCRRNPARSIPRLRRIFPQSRRPRSGTLWQR